LALKKLKSIANKNPEIVPKGEKPLKFKNQIEARA